MTFRNHCNEFDAKDWYMTKFDMSVYVWLTEVEGSNKKTQLQILNDSNAPV